MTTPVLYVREKQLRDGEIASGLTAAAADLVREPLKVLLDNFMVDRELMNDQLEDYFQSPFAPVVVEYLALIAAMADNPERIEEHDLLSQAGFALMLLFESDWCQLSRDCREKLANQLLGYLQVTTTDATPGGSVSTFSTLAQTSIKLELNHADGKSVYRDSDLFIGTEKCLKNMKPELYICLPHRKWYVWSFIPLPGMNIIPPLSSIKAARSVVKQWRGKRLSGGLCGKGAERICRVLGLEVKGYASFLNPQSKGFGSAQPQNA